MRNQILTLSQYIEAGIDPDDFYDISIDKQRLSFQGNATALSLAKYQAMGYKFEYMEDIQMLKVVSDNIKIVFTL